MGCNAGVVANTIFGLFVNLSSCIADDYNRKYKSNRMSADAKTNDTAQKTSSRSQRRTPSKPRAVLV